MVVVALFAMGMARNGAVEFVMGVACQMMGMGMLSSRYRLSSRQTCGSHVVDDGDVIKGDDCGGRTVCDGGDGVEWAS